MAFITRDNFEVCSNTLQATALDVTRLAASSLPPDLAFHRSVDQSLAHDLDSLSTRVLGLANRIIQLSSKDNAANFGRLEDEEDVVDEFSRNIVDAMEGMLERTDGALDEFLGRKKPPAVQAPSTLPDSHHNSEAKTRALPRGRLEPTITHASHLPKPQLRFRYLRPNTDESPYIPVALIAHKWCAKVPLGYIFEDNSSRSEESIQNEEDEEEEKKRRILHPYYYEVMHPTYPAHIFDPPSNPVRPSSLDASPSRSYTFVANSKDFLSFANTLSSVQELAVDLEHHSYRSYRGFLALMQISTRQEDFIIDLLAPDIREGLRQRKGKSPSETADEKMANEAGEIIARVFADPSVVKVFHGADSDIVWLQQDFNIFVVGLFDTFHASKILEFPKHSLAKLLETYCDFVPDKRYQLADWRIRPLPIEMLTYAQSDTHFLLYIYDRLRLALVDKAISQFPLDSSPGSTPTITDSRTDPYTLIRDVLARSARTALRLYEVEAYDALGGSGSGGWDTLARKWNKVALTASGGFDYNSSEGNGTTSVLVAVYRAVHRWREDVAREEDESTRYVLPTHHLFLIAERPPSSASDLVSLFDRAGGGSGVVPPVLRRRMGELVSAVKSAIDSVAVFLKRSTELEAAETATGKVSVDISATVQHTRSNEIVEVIPTDIESRLWSMPASSSSVASHSVLFSSAQAKASVLRETSAYTAAHSTLLGNTSRIIAPRSLKPAMMPNTAVRFRDIAERIHRALVIAPVVSLPTAVSTVETTISNSTLEPSSVVPSDSGRSTPPCEPVSQIEIPFVPQHQRQSHLSLQAYAPMEDDTIVVVGQAGARQRKRKREKNRGMTSQLRSGSGATVGDQEAGVGAFDYSTVPNLLDEVSERDRTNENDRGKKKARQSKGECHQSSASSESNMDMECGIGLPTTLRDPNVSLV
ncbi:ribonuclease H-like domain-containing protein [Pisolithus sp. B1]|nr:ribonuclease H-like domain-containing protein [Pisolithus sp. B1]